MSVKFYVDEGSPSHLIVTHDQAAAILTVLGVEADEVPQGASPPERSGPFRGTMLCEWLSLRLNAVNRQLLKGRVREFTSPDLTTDSLITCLRSLRGMTEIAAKEGKPVHFRDVI